jgi:hypothetical protein
MTKDRTQHYAFARGYYDARVHGVEQSPYSPEWAALSSLPYSEIDRLRDLYADGYEWGISDYCLENHADEVNR